MGSADIVRADSGVLRINSTGNTWGNTDVRVGTLRIGVADALPASTVLNIGQADSQAATFDLDGYDQTVVGLSSVSTGGIKQVTSETAATFTVNSAATNTYAGQINGAIALAKQNTGTLTLSGNNSYTGATTVSAGTLLVTGQLGNTDVSVAADAAFGGIGTVGGNIAFASGSFFEVSDLDAPLNVGGTITFGPGFGIGSLLGIDWDALDMDTPYTLVNNIQTFTASDIGNFGPANAAAVGTGRQAYFKDGSLQVVVIPEPGAALLGGLGVLLLLRRRRG